MSWTTIRPVGFRVLVKMHDKRSHYGTLEIPDEFRRQQETGVVLAKGVHVSDELKPGTIVVFGKYNGVELPNPEFDLHAEPGTYRMCECDLVKRGKKLPQNVMGYTHVPHLTDIYGVVDTEGADEGEIARRLSSDMYKGRVA